MPKQMSSFFLKLCHYLPALSLALLLAACAGIAPPTGVGQAVPVERHYQDAIELAGRLSVRYVQNGQDQALHGGFTWSQRTDHLVVHLFSPLGQTLVIIDVKPHLALLMQSGKAPLSATDVDALSTQALNWPLPVSGLREWLQGFGHGADGQTFVAHPATSSSSFITPDGWSISYGEWQEETSQALLNRPKRIDLTRQTQQGPVSIRIVIDQWQVLDPQTKKPSSD